MDLLGGTQAPTNLWQVLCWWDIRQNCGIYLVASDAPDTAVHWQLVLIY